MGFFTQASAAQRYFLRNVLQCPVDLRLPPLRFRFRASDPIYFPAGMASNILRGAFGILFRRIACRPECPGAAECPSRASCAYARTFEPAALAPGPSGFADLPLPFVFRPTPLDETRLEPGADFHFDLN